MLSARCGCRSDFYWDVAIEDAAIDESNHLDSSIAASKFFSIAAFFYCGTLVAVEKECRSRKGYLSSIAALFYCGALGAIEEKRRTQFERFYTLPVLCLNL